MIAADNQGDEMSRAEGFKAKTFKVNGVEIFA